MFREQHELEIGDQSCEKIIVRPLLCIKPGIRPSWLKAGKYHDQINGRQIHWIEDYHACNYRFWICWKIQLDLETTDVL